MRLLSNVTEWFIEVTVFEDAAGLLSADFFVFLDVDAAMMEITAEMQLKREGGYILVAARHRTDPGARQRFELVVFHTWLFVKVPDSSGFRLATLVAQCWVRYSWHRYRWSRGLWRYQEHRRTISAACKQFCLLFDQQFSSTPRAAHAQERRPFQVLHRF